MCEGQLDGHIGRCAHQHIAGWKKHGTFRLHVVTEKGTRRTFIFKDEIYTLDEIPALRELSVRPGPPEYHVYTQSADSPLSTFLPRLFWHAELEPGRHFRYLLEDLQLRYRRLHFRRRDLLFAVRVLMKAQKAMKSTFEKRGDKGLIRYDKTYSEKMIEYARNSLEEYASKTNDGEAKEIIGLWSNILEIHETKEAFGDELNQPIHGDYTLPHVHWKHGAEGAKIVDWEWAGLGMPHADLAALLKWADPEIRREAIGILVKEHGKIRLEEHDRLLNWCLLERKLLDAGFFAKQQMKTGRNRGERYLRRTVTDILAIARELR
jgi:hypothetical protein